MPNKTPFNKFDIFPFNHILTIEKQNKNLILKVIYFLQFDKFTISQKLEMLKNALK